MLLPGSIALIPHTKRQIHRLQESTCFLPRETCWNSYQFHVTKRQIVLLEVWMAERSSLRPAAHFGVSAQQLLARCSSE